MNRAAIYVRLSDEDDGKGNKYEESESIQNQKSLLIDYALKESWEVYNIYCDEDLSGAGTYRPAFEKMILDAEENKFDIILCKTQSRFSRDLEIIEKYLHNKFTEWNIRFVSVVDNADTHIKGNKKSRQINGLINEWFLEDLSDNIRAVLKNKKERGLYTGSTFPFGYKKAQADKNKLVIDEPAAQVVREIFDKFLIGYSYYKIANEVNIRRIPTPWQYKKEIYGIKINVKGTSKKIWSRDIIRNMIRNPVYIGTLVQGKTETISYKNSKKRIKDKKDWIVSEKRHEPIIDIEKWQTVQKKLETRSRVDKNTGEVHIFSGKVFCEECGNIFHKCKSHDYEYLRCKTINMDKNFCKNVSRIRISELTEIILAELNILIQRYKQDKILKEKINITNKYEDQIDFLEQEMVVLYRELGLKKEFLKNLYKDKIKGVLSEEDFLLLKECFYEEREVLEENIKLKRVQLEDICKKTQTLPDKDELIRQYGKLEILDRNMVEMFISRIAIGAKDADKVRKIAIDWLV